MVMTDPIADMLTRVRNANSVYHSKVEIPASKIKKAIAEVLKEEGFIKDYTFTADSKQGMLTVFLKYGPAREKVITGIKRISKPGLRAYAKHDERPRYLCDLHVEGDHERQGSPQGRPRRRSRRLCLVNVWR